MSIDFQEIVEVELQKNRCKIFDFFSLVLNTSILMPTNNIELYSNLTEWFADSESVSKVLASNSCLVVIDGSFYPEYPDFISVH